MGISLWQSLCDRAEAMARNALEDAKTLANWEGMRTKRRADFMRCMGLDPLPKRCDLKTTDYGEFKGEGFRARRIGFQILPDCWTSACVYYPDPAPKAPAPGVLYVCGHTTIGTYGLQSHPIMWARRGYVCLIVDTIEQNDNPGEHHAFETGVLGAWLAMGYTAAGGEMWNAVRALDVLADDPAVDAERLGATGVSGGGGCSFFLAIADERVKAVSTLCGISTPVDAIVNRHLISHCNCMYPHHLFRRDTSEYAALIAPRAALFCFADDDQIFNADETRALVERTGRVYRLYEREDMCELITCPGPHGDHPEFDEATSKWFDRHLAGEERPIVKRPERELSESVVSVFNGRPPSPNRMDILPRLISPRGTVPLPSKPEDWPEIRRRALDAMPAIPGDDGRTFLKLSGLWRRGEGANTAHFGRIDGIDVWLHVSTRTAAPAKLIMAVAGPGEGSRDVMGCIGGLASDSNDIASAGFEPRLGGLSFAGLASRSSGALSKWSIEKLLPFALPLTGVTPVTMTIHDIGVALDYLRGLEGFGETEIYLYGKDDAGVAALYKGILDERVAGVILENPPASHEDASPILGILRAFDMPEAVGLMAPRKVALVNAGHSYWTWPDRIYGRLECPERCLRTDSLQAAVRMMLTS